MKNTIKLGLLCTAFIVTNTQSWIGTALRITAKTSILLGGYAALKTVENNGIIHDEAEAGYPELPATEHAHYERVKEIFVESFGHFKTGCKHLNDLKQFPYFIKEDLEQTVENFKAKQFGQKPDNQENKPEETQNSQEKPQASDSEE